MRLFQGLQAACWDASRSSRLSPRISLEVLETRLAPALGLANAFVVPVSEPIDANHVHTLAAAVEMVMIGGVVTVEPGASPDPVGIASNANGLTIQGDPNVPASILPSEPLLLTGSNNTLTNLNFGSLVLGSGPGDNATSGNHVSKCLINSLTENGVLSTFTQNTFTGAALFQGVTLAASGQSAFNGDQISDNLFENSGNPSLHIIKCAGINVMDSTFYIDSGTTIVMEGSGSPLAAQAFCTIAGNTIVRIVNNVSFSGFTSDRVGIQLIASTVEVLNNTINTNRGTGLSMQGGFALIQGNDFTGNALGIIIDGNGTSANRVDLGRGSVASFGSSSLGGNDFRGFTAPATLSTAAIVLTNTPPAAVVSAAGNIFRTGVSPSTVVDDGVNGSATGTGQINASALDGPHALVQTLYNEVLGRTGTSSELDPWVSLLNTQGQVTVVNDILHSSEALGRIVDQFYLRFLGRTADPGGRAGWIGYLQNGGTEEAIESLFLTSPEYLRHINVDFVQSLYLYILGRPGSPVEVAEWNNNIQNVGGIMGVANAFTHSPENRLTTLRSDFRTFLHRTPADPS
jgi:hypothetical protein